MIAVYETKGGARPGARVGRCPALPGGSFALGAGRFDTGRGAVCPPLACGKPPRGYLQTEEGAGA